MHSYLTIQTKNTNVCDTKQHKTSVKAFKYTRIAYISEILTLHVVKFLLNPRYGSG